MKARRGIEREPSSTAVDRLVSRADIALDSLPGAGGTTLDAVAFTRDVEGAFDAMWKRAVVAPRA